MRSGSSCMISAFVVQKGRNENLSELRLERSERITLAHSKAQLQAVASNMTCVRDRSLQPSGERLDYASGKRKNSGGVRSPVANTACALAVPPMRALTRTKGCALRVAEKRRTPDSPQALSSARLLQSPMNIRHGRSYASMTIARFRSFLTESVGCAPVSSHFLMLGAFRLHSLVCGL